MTEDTRREYTLCLNLDWHLTTALNSTKARTQSVRNSEVYKWLISLVHIVPLENSLCSIQYSNPLTLPEKAA